MTTATRTTTQLRYYPNLLKMQALLAASLAFVFVGVSLLTNGSHSDLRTLAAAYLAIGFFGLCALVAIAFVGLIVIIRRPMLLINSRGLFTPFPVIRVGKDIHWEDVAEIVVYKRRRRRASSSLGSYSTWYTLTIKARNPAPLSGRGQKLGELAMARYPHLLGAVISLPMSYVFLRPTDAKVMAILAQIRGSFAPEIARYGIVVQDTIQRV